MTPCKAEGCANPARGRGLCAKHYQADRRRTAGASQREKLGPEPKRREVLFPQSLDAELLTVVRERDVGAFIRRAVRTQLALERGAGKPVRFG